LAVTKTKIGPNDVEQLGMFLELMLKPGHSESIAPMLTDIRANIGRKALALKQDAPLSIFFEARP
jgi:hypothetical protein